MDLAIVRTEHDDTVVLACTGRLDAETGDELARAVADELRRGLHAIRLDLADVSFLSSAGIRGLFETQRAAKQAGGTCFISAASPVVRKVLDMTRLTPILMESAAASPVAVPARPVRPPTADVTCGPVRLRELSPAAAPPLAAQIGGTPGDPWAGRGLAAVVTRLPPHVFAVGLGAIADALPASRRAGELLAACGTLFHRPAQPHAAVDYVVPTGALVAEANLLTALVWEGVPSGHAGFEPMGDEPAVRLDDLVAALFEQSSADTLGIVVAGEVHGMVGAELIRPLDEAADGDTPWVGTRDVVATWLSFSREPVFARHTAVIVGVACRGRGAGRLAGFVRAVPGREFSGHFHAVVFPFRPLRRGGVDLAGTVADLAASVPLSVMHLIADPQPVLGSGRTELARGTVWFAPLTLSEQGDTP
jgi:anti-anti-sigma factor